MQNSPSCCCCYYLYCCSVPFIVVPPSLLFSCCCLCCCCCFTFHFICCFWHISLRYGCRSLVIRHTFNWRERQAEWGREGERLWESDGKWNWNQQLRRRQWLRRRLAMQMLLLRSGFPRFDNDTFEDVDILRTFDRHCRFIIVYNDILIEFLVCN